MPAARRFIVSGRVQGVGFRFFVQSAAEREGLRGWVRNLPDGRVEVMAEGEADGLDRLEQALQRGPEMARVAGVVTEPAAVASGLTDFEIR